MPPLKQLFSPKNLYLFGLFLIIVGMPLSAFLMSLGQFVLLGNWILEGDFRRKWRVMKSSKALWVLCSFYLMHLLGLLYTSDFNYALNDLRIKLPLLWLPLLFITSAPLTQREFKFLLHTFIFSVLSASLICFSVWLGYTKHKVVDIRDISIFTSHIRFALMIVLCIALLFQDYFKSGSWYLYLGKILLVLWFIAFLGIMESMTGILILLLLSCFMLIRYLLRGRFLAIKLIPASVLLAMLVYGIMVINREWKSYFHLKDSAYNTINPNEKTPGGRLYFHDTNTRVTENGYYVWIYNSYPELQQEWDKRSQVNYNSTDAKGNLLAFTLVRYLSAKGLKKDSAAVAQLKPEEIKLIEQGVSNYLYADRGNLASRLHELIWEYDNYRNGGSSSGHSLFMRLEYWKTAWHIIKNNPFGGVGTGDTQQAFKQQYLADHSALNKRWQLHSHNQFLTITVSFGIIGLCIFMLWIFYPVLAVKNKSPYFILFFIIAMLSMLNEDTLETQAGVTFFGFFYAFFNFLHPGNSHK